MVAFKAIFSGKFSNIYEDNFISSFFSGIDFLKEVERADVVTKDGYETAINKPLYLLHFIADMKTITNIKSNSYKKQFDEKYEGSNRGYLLKAELLCIAAAKYNIPYYAAEYVANRLIWLRGKSEEAFREAYELILAKATPDEEERKSMPDLEKIYSDHFFGYINMRVSNVTSTIGECLSKYYLDEIIDNEACDCDLVGYIKECTQVPEIYREVSGETELAFINNGLMAAAKEDNLKKKKVTKSALKKVIKENDYDKVITCSLNAVIKASNGDMVKAMYILKRLHSEYQNDNSDISKCKVDEEYIVRLLLV